MTREARLLEALASWFGGRWTFDVLPDAETGRLDVYVVARVVEVVERERHEVAIDDVHRVIDPTFEVGDDVLVQVFYRPGEEGAQTHQEQLHAELLQLDETFAAGLAALRLGWVDLLV